MFIRKANLSDLNKIMQIEKQCFISQIQEERIVFEKRIKYCNDTFFVFEEDNNVVGYLSAERLDEVPQNANELKLNHTPKKNNTGKVIYISSFCLISEYRGKGNGSYLWNESIKILEKLNGIESIILIVNEVWNNAYKIYEKSGFKKLFRLPLFFSTEEDSFTDGILMQKVLI